ncbi:hypothetical protein [Pigmentiphaga litoralis]|uniref:hypothetical protein n=1 Tax=Pigmentiphaga litoralis TaxID=516702 RepID=UPI00167A9F4E|nr:hypothetical protein [Pigmentiphaga litoralis]
MGSSSNSRTTSPPRQQFAFSTNPFAIWPSYRVDVAEDASAKVVLSAKGVI